MKPRTAGFVSLTLGAIGCGEPVRPPELSPQVLFGKDVTAVDGSKTGAWRKYVTAEALHGVWAPPAKSPWRPFYKPTLVAAMAVVEKAAMPVRTQDGSLAETRANALAASISLQNAAVFVDLPGEESVGWASVLAHHGFQPVLTINNWPHQRGILRLERPLGALLYHARGIADLRLALDAPPAFILEGTRLKDKSSNPRPDEFDNRFFHAITDLPPAALLKSRSIARVIYVSYRGARAGGEEDDLVEYFVQLKAAGLAFTYVLPVGGSFEAREVSPVARPTIFSPAQTTAYSSRSGSHHRHFSSYQNHYWSSSRGTWGSGPSGFTGSS